MLQMHTFNHFLHRSVETTVIKKLQKGFEKARAREDWPS